MPTLNAHENARPQDVDGDARFRVHSQLAYTSSAPQPVIFYLEKQSRGRSNPYTGWQLLNLLNRQQGVQLTLDEDF